MPAKNRLKTYLENAYYHIYNRGVEKREIFLDEQDRNVFNFYLKTYLTPKDVQGLQDIIADPSLPWGQKDVAIKQLRLNNFSDRICLVCYCFMPNHFHFVVRQTDDRAIDVFMNSLCTRYSIYFNRKYKRVGPLFQGVYKGVGVDSDEQLLYLTRYVHRNPKAMLQGQALQSYQYSSYPVYLGMKETEWVMKTEILSFFSKTGFTSYQSFVEDMQYEEGMINTLSRVALDLDA